MHEGGKPYFVYILNLILHVSMLSYFFILQNNVTERGCNSGDIYELLFNILNGNSQNLSNCNNFRKPPVPMTYRTGRLVYVYLTPIVLIIGILGNSLSLNVFLSKNMRGMSASAYLAALSASDLSTLIFYVTVEWLRRGIVYIYPETQMAFLEYNGFCQILMYLSYVSRFLSSWLVVAFTVERYIGVCHPLRRRHICTRSSTRRIIAAICLSACILVLYKPILSGVYHSADGTQYCTSDKHFGFTSFVLDSTFAVTITLIPFVIITVLNILIVRTLFRTNRRHNNCATMTCNKKMKSGMVIRTEESIIKLEFTFILLAVSFFFIAFNVPYFTIWFRNFIYNTYITQQNKASIEDIEYWQGVLYVSRTIFYLNYCINFFLYSITGTYFRKEVKYLFSLKARQGLFEVGRYSRNSHLKVPASWV